MPLRGLNMIGWDMEISERSSILVTNCHSLQHLLFCLKKRVFIFLKSTRLSICWIFFKVYGDKALYVDEGIRYELGRCDLEPLDKGVKSVLVRRIYHSVNFEKFCLAHYRITHHAGGQCSEDTDETLKNSAGSNGNGDASGDIQDDDALSALNTDLSDGHDADATDIAPVPAATASTTIVVNELTEARKEKEATLHSSARAYNAMREDETPQHWHGGTIKAVIGSSTKDEGEDFRDCWL
ncbi:hypothetical protein AALP_AA3G192300 [Arabis alpina]|uniref:Uncharacterized protein n=1 Tax=Arabis alpina TaxID=50452 RepID=A0A087HA84_ARAAL|nr:hypothetical protein AALP_AA3G192300 [Arabis alpina]